MTGSRGPAAPARTGGAGGREMCFNAPSVGHPLQWEGTYRVSWVHMEPTSGLTGRAGGVRKTYKNLVATGPGIVSIIYRVLLYSW